MPPFRHVVRCQANRAVKDGHQIQSQRHVVESVARVKRLQIRVCAGSMDSQGPFGKAVERKATGILRRVACCIAHYAKASSNLTVRAFQSVARGFMSHIAVMSLTLLRSKEKSGHKFVAETVKVVGVKVRVRTLLEVVLYVDGEYVAPHFKISQKTHTM